MADAAGVAAGTVFIGGRKDAHMEAVMMTYVQNGILMTKHTQKNRRELGGAIGITLANRHTSAGEEIVTPLITVSIL